MTRCVRPGIRVGVATAGGSLLLASCGVGANPVMNPELSEDDVTITMNWWGADARTQQTLQAIELFEREHPNIDVEPTYSDWSGYWDRLATTTAGGDMPDVTQLEQAYLASYASRGALLDLSTVTNILDTSALPADLLNSGRVGDDLYAVPVGATTNAVLINTTLFERYGVAIPDTTAWTWDDFEQAAVALSEAADGEAHGVLPFGADAFSLTVWARQHGGELYDAEGNLVIQPDVLAAYWQRELDLIGSGAAPSVAQLSEALGLPLDQSNLVTGTVAMAFISAGQFTAFQEAAPDFDFALANWPSDSDTEPGFQYLKPTMYWSAASTSEHPAEAALLIDFLTNDTRVAEIFGLDRGEPGNPAFMEAVEAQVDDNGREVLAFAEDMADEVGGNAPITPSGASDIALLLSRYNQQVLYGDSTPAEAAEAFINELGDSIRAAR